VRTDIDSSNVIVKKLQVFADRVSMRFLTFERFSILMDQIGRMQSSSRPATRQLSKKINHPVALEIWLLIEYNQLLNLWFHRLNKSSETTSKSQKPIWNNSSHRPTIVSSNWPKDKPTVTVNAVVSFICLTC
jgi:hypothetical protein